MDRNPTGTREYRLAKTRHEYMESAAAKRGILPDKVEPGADGAIDCFVEQAVPDLELYWSLEVGGEGIATAEFCLWFKDNPERQHACCFHLTFSANGERWIFGFERDPEARHESPRAKRLASQAFGFKGPGSREVCEEAALRLIDALCAGFASQLNRFQDTGLE